VTLELNTSPAPLVEYGKVSDKLETTGLENKTTITVYFDHERSRFSPSLS
jgi:hypothetical protein